MEKNDIGITKKSDEISLKNVILQIRLWYKYLLSKWIVITFSVVLGALIGLLYVLQKKPVYTAVSTFVLEDSGTPGGALAGQYSGLASMVGIDIQGGGGVFQGDNLLILYQSRNMIMRALLSPVQINNKNQLLIDRYIEVNGYRESWKNNPKLKKISFQQNSTLSRLQDSIITAFVNDINYDKLTVSKLDKKLSIIKVEVKSEDEIFSKLFNDRIVATVNEFYIQTKTKKSLDNLAILQHQTDSVKRVLNGAIYTTAAVVDATPNLNPTKQILRVSGQKSQFNAEANKAILTQLVQNLELSKITLRKETPLIQLLDYPVYPLFKYNISKLKGLIIGSLIFGIITVIVLLVKKIVKSVIE